MLTAWDKPRQVTLALPDFEAGSALQEVRARARRGDLVCPTCDQLLWVHAGEVLIPHFAHRRLSRIHAVEN
jgi:competence CoiA-like predicted nuclease